MNEQKAVFLDQGRDLPADSGGTRWARIPSELPIRAAVSRTRGLRSMDLWPSGKTVSIMPGGAFVLNTTGPVGSTKLDSVAL
jgi:hypothetical protein